MQGIKNIIFDLGGVLLRINYKDSEAAFSRLGLENYNQYFKQDYSSALFEQLETGLIDETFFFNEFRKTFSSTISSGDIILAWNAMLGDFIPQNLRIVSEAAKHYNVYLFSNTNHIHYVGFMDIYKNQFGNTDFDNYFIKAYYSHLCGWRKPDPQAYLNLLEAEKLNASETLFIDDTLKNIAGAKEAGLKTFHLVHPSLLSSLDL